LGSWKRNPAETNRFSLAGFVETTLTDLGVVVDAVGTSGSAAATGPAAAARTVSASRPETTAATGREVLVRLVVGDVIAGSFGRFTFDRTLE
jgi:hypothetical protein